MNIISSSCLGGFIYRDVLKQEYENPFIWTRIDVNIFLELVENYEHIDFEDVMIDKNGKEFKNNFITVINKKYRIQNNHIFFSLNDDKPRISGVDVFYQKPWMYILEKYLKRLKRMKEQPIIIVDDTFTKIHDLIATCKKKKFRCMIFNNSLSEQKTYYLYVKNYDIKNLKSPSQFTQKYKVEIKNWLYEN